jgi:tyrosyl-tRNA synthetase
MVMPILEGTDGVEKMSKSLGNAIGITEPAQEIFGKTMQISDELMFKWYHHLFHELLDHSMHPMEAKKQLASRIVARYHGEAAGVEARAEFERVFSKKELPTEMKEHTASENPIWIVKLLVEAGACTSNGDARRLVQQGAVSLDGTKITDPQTKVEITGEHVLQSGKRFFAKVRR